VKIFSPWPKRCSTSPGEIARDENEAHNHARHQVPQNQLQEPHVRAIGDSRSADDRQDAGFCRDDGQGNGPPGKAAPAQEVVAQRMLALAEVGAEHRDRKKIRNHHDEVEPAEGH